MSEDRIKKPSPPAVQIIRHISEGAYTGFPKAIREVVNNAFDARATKVTLDFKKENSELTIWDNGTGVDEKTFDNEFLRISGSTKRLQGDTDPITGRPILGVFGVGVFAIAAVCEEALVETTLEGDAEGYIRKIDLKKFFDPRIQRDNLEDHLYSEHVKYFESKPEEHYTSIRLIGLKPEIQEQLNHKEEEPRKIRGINGLENFSQLKGIDWFTSELGLLIPVEYEKDFPVVGLKIDPIEKAREELKKFNFHVYVNSRKLLKPIRLGRRFSDKFSWPYEKITNEIPTDPEKLSSVTPIWSEPGAKIRFFGYIYEQSKQIFPGELRGLLIRVSHVGVKGYDRSFYKYTLSNLGPSANHISGEIYIEKGLESSIWQMNKDDFQQDLLDFKKLIQPIHKKIQEVRNEMGKRTSRVRKHKKAKEKPVEKPKTIRDALKQKSPLIDEMRKDIGAEEFKKYLPKKPDQTIDIWSSEIKQRIKKLATSASIPEEKSYLYEAMECFENNCLRATVVLFWNATIHRMHKKIEQRGFPAFDQALSNVAQSRAFSWFRQYTPKNCTSLEEFKDCVKDQEVLFAISGPGLGLMTVTECKLMGKDLQLRHSCAHPTNYQPNHREVLITIELLLQRILENSNFRV